MKSLYLAFCRRWGPDRLTYSAWAWKHFAVTGDTFWRDRIDGFMLFWSGDHQHCYRQWQRETRGF